MRKEKFKQMGREAGMTLIELTVVLLVLIGLAGLALPYISGFVGKTHNATSAASGAELFLNPCSFRFKGCPPHFQRVF